MATHSSILAWRIPWTKELGGLQSTGRKELDTTERLHFTHFHLGNPPGRARSSFKASRKFALKKETWGGSQPLCTKPAFRESPLHPTPHTRPCGKMSPVWRAVGGVSLGEEWGLGVGRRWRARWECFPPAPPHFFFPIVSPSLPSWLTFVHFLYFSCPLSELRLFSIHLAAISSVCMSFLYVNDSFFFFHFNFYLYTIFKGYFSFTVIIKYWL